VPISLAMDYGMVAETLGTVAAPLDTMTPLTLMSLGVRDRRTRQNAVGKTG